MIPVDTFACVYHCTWASQIEYSILFDVCLILAVISVSAVLMCPIVSKLYYVCILWFVFVDYIYIYIYIYMFYICICVSYIHTY